MGNLERFKTPTDRIKEQLYANPDITFRQAAENILTKHGITIPRTLFYKTKSYMNSGRLSKRPKEECLKKLEDFICEYGIDALSDIDNLLDSFTRETVIEQSQILFARIKNK